LIVDSLHLPDIQLFVIICNPADVLKCRQGLFFYHNVISSKVNDIWFENVNNIS